MKSFSIEIQFCPRITNSLTCENFHGLSPRIRRLLFKKNFPLNLKTIAIIDSIFSELSEEEKLKEGIRGWEEIKEDTINDMIK